MTTTLDRMIVTPTSTGTSGRAPVAGNTCPRCGKVKSRLVFPAFGGDDQVICRNCGKPWPTEET